jgi:hypothetical protein
MKAQCPECGAEVEFRYDDSFVRICTYCRAAVVRTDRGVDSLGKVADLMPIESPLRLFADGQLGSQTFILVGMAQLRHAAGGITQEWYAKFSGTWGWLAEAQGRYYMTFEVEGVPLPPLGSLSPGVKVQLPTMLGAQREFTVAEKGSATYLAANGELPFRLEPNSGYQFVDLSDGTGNFATIDYSGDAPTLYTGQQLTLQELNIRGGEHGPAMGDARVSAKKLACPNCNAGIELRAEGLSQRATCPNCNALVDLQEVRVVAQLKADAQPIFPLGKKGKFIDGELTLIGFVQRSAMVEGQWYSFYEYLLFAPEVGFRWLVNSDGHWSYVQPVDIAAVSFDGGDAKYDGVKFRLFQASQLRVDTVLGEFYWQVKAGETVFGQDFIAPPAMLSQEDANGETTWSLSTYMKHSEVKEAFGTEDYLGSTTGVGANQPDPAARVATPLTLSFVALIVMGIIFAMMASPAEKFSTTVSIPAGVPAQTAESPNVFFSEPFALEGGKNIELGFRANLSNNWAYTVASLVNVSSGDLVTVDASMESYSGVEGGESWSEGKDYDTEVVGPVPAGQYVLRLESQHGATALDVPMTVRVRQGVFRWRYLGLALGVLGIPFFIFGFWSYRFEKRRWENSNAGSMPKTATYIVLVGIGMLLGGIVLLIKAILEASSDD